PRRATRARPRRRGFPAADTGRGRACRGTRPRRRRAVPADSGSAVPRRPRRREPTPPRTGPAPKDGVARARVSAGTAYLLPPGRVGRVDVHDAPAPGRLPEDERAAADRAAVAVELERRHGGAIE